MTNIHREPANSRVRYDSCMSVQNIDIAKVFDEIGDLLEIKGDNPFRIRAYRNAARTVEGLGVSAADMLAKGEDLTELPGIGKDLAAKMQEIVARGTCEALEDLRKQLPPGLTTLLKIPGLGPKRVQTLYQQLDIGTPEQLYAAAHDGKIRELAGFGEKTEITILQSLEKRVVIGTRVRLADAAKHAEPLRNYLAQIPGAQQVAIAGSYRRYKETIGDIDIVVTAKRGSPVMDKLCDYDQVEKVVSKGSTRATVNLKGGLQVDVRVVPQASFGAAMHYFTGSKTHNIAVRRLGQQKRLKINEYGVFRGERRIAGDTEESVFQSVGLPYIPPELRENRGEIEAARAGTLPKLIELGDIKGNLHTHTVATDGKNTLEEMAAAARAHGLQYLAITEHTRHIMADKGFDADRLRRQMLEIDKLNDKLNGITLLKGIEVDILENGDLDLPDAVLAELDIVVASVHLDFDLPRMKQTERILRALDNRYVHILAHPAGRLLGERPAREVDMPKIIRAARDRGCFLELNAQPQRLDLPDTYCKMAKDEGVSIAINIDAHSTQDFDNLKYGVGYARRGWLEARDVANTRTLDELRALLRR